MLAICAGYVVALAFVPGLANWSPIVCPTYRCLGLHCPGCGLTRAIAVLARLDPMSAVRFHPLVLLVAPAAILVSLDACLAAAGMRGVLASLPAIVTRVFCGVLVVGFGLVFIVRLVSWLAPACNPSGWLVPPQAFPA